MRCSAFSFAAISSGEPTDMMIPPTCCCVIQPLIFRHCGASALT